MREKLNYLITGGTGFIGKNLVLFLLQKYENINIFVLTRNTKVNIFKSNRVFLVDSLNNIPSCDVVINLAGKSISSFPWNKKNKTEILNSRLLTTQKLIEYVKNTTQKPRVFINASAVGFYNLFNNDNVIINEDYTTYNLNSFSYILCKLWENEATKVLNFYPDIKLSILRFGVVFGKDGGFIKKIIFPLKLNLLFLFGKGNNYMPWVHIEDVVNAIDFVVKQPLHRTYNVVAPSFNTQKEIVFTFAKLLNKTVWFFLPNFLVKLFFGQMGRELFLANQKIQSLNLLKQGFVFKYNNLKDAFKSII